MDYSTELSFNDYIIMYSRNKFDLPIINNLYKTENKQESHEHQLKTQVIENKLVEDFESKLYLINK